MPNLVYAGSGHEVKIVMVAGQVLVRNGDGVRAEVLVAQRGWNPRRGGRPGA